jgi:hypothetical protein
MPGGPYRIVQFDQPFGAGVQQSWRLSVSTVAKSNEPDAAPYCLPNELICGEIGRFLGLPIPPGAIVHAPRNPQAEHWYASLDFNLTGNSLPPVDVDDCVTRLPDLSTGCYSSTFWSRIAIAMLEISPSISSRPGGRG